MTQEQLVVCFAFVVVVLVTALILALWALVLVPIALCRLCATRYYSGSKGEATHKKVPPAFHVINFTFSFIYLRYQSDLILSSP